MKRIRNWSGLCALACTCVLACRAPTPPHGLKPVKPLAGPSKSVELPVSATATSKPALSLAAAATLENSVNSADYAAPLNAHPTGFDDVPWLLDRASAWLRARAGGAKTQPAVWQRRDRHGWQSDVLEWRPEGFALRTQGDDATVLLTEAGCFMRVGKFSARCEPDIRASALAAAVLTGLAWPDGPGRAAWTVEAIHVRGAKGSYLRLALAKLHLRVDLDVASDGTVASMTILGALLQPDADGFSYANGAISWHWSVQPAGTKEALTRSYLRVDNSAGGDVNLEAWQAAAKKRGLVPVGPFTVELDLREDGPRPRVIEAPVLADPEPQAQEGAQIVALSLAPAVSTFHCRRADLMRALREATEPGCHIAQLLGLDPAAPPNMNDAERHRADVMVALRPCQ